MSVASGRIFRRGGSGVGKSAEKPRRNVVSFRVTDEELEQLKEAARSRRSNVGDLVLARVFGGEQ